MTDRPTTQSPLDDASSLDDRERAVHRELLRLDPQLADLFNTGHGLMRKSGLSNAYMLAHAGRELSRGVINVLTGTVDSLSADRQPDADTPEESRPDKFRKRISDALLLTEQHGVVSAWFDAHDTFTRNSHFHAQGRDLEAVRSAYFRLSALLYGRLAPFFVASASLDHLSSVDQPTPDDADAVTALLSRPQLRRQFFMSATSPAWIPLLTERGHFASPPDRLFDADGSWRMVAWPEGDFLARSAPARPSEAVAQLLQVPENNSNPLVWGTLVDAALTLDDPFATQLAARVVRRLPTLPAAYLPHKAVDLLVHLAALASPSALPLLRALLKMRSEEDREDHLNTLKTKGTLALMTVLSTEWTLAQLDMHELQRLVEQAVPALVRFDSLATFTALAKVLGRSLYLLREQGADRGDWASSQTWCPNLETADSRDDVRAVLLSATVRAAVAAAGNSPEGLNAVLAELKRRPGVIWQRITWHVVAVTQSDVIDAVEALIGSDVLLESRFGLREAGMLLRAHFTSASADARARFVAALIASPLADEMQRRIAVDKEWRPDDVGPDLEPISDDVRAQRIKTSWQLRRLRLFHADLPTELSDLAQSLGYVPSTPTREQQASDEGVMLWTGVSSWGGPPSPKSVEELSEMSPQSFLAFLNTWQPDEHLGSGRDARWSLNQVVTQYATLHVDAATSALAAGASDGLADAHAIALIDGIREAITKASDVPWPSLMAALAAVVERTTADESPHKQDKVAARVSLVQSVVRALITACSSDKLPPEHFEHLRIIVRALVTSYLPSIGLIPDSDHWHSIVSNALNRPGGDIVRLLVNAGLWDYRRLRGGDGNGGGEWTGPEESVEVWVSQLLTTLLTLSERRDDAISISMARQIEWIRLLSPRWVKENEERLFSNEGGTINPSARAMVEGEGPWRSSILDSRSVLLQLTVAVAATPSDDHSDDSLGTALLWRCVVGFLWGAWGREESDGIFELGFEASTAKERGHVYWRIFRSLSDTNAADPEFTARALELWKWRIAQLKAMGAVPERSVEAEGLLWLLKSPHLAPAAVVTLGLETLQLGPFSDRLATDAWERASRLMETVPTEAFELFAQLLELQLRTDYPYVPFDFVAPGLRAALRIEETGARERAAALVHRLGEQGHREFGRLLTE